MVLFLTTSLIVPVNADFDLMDVREIQHFALLEDQVQEKISFMVWFHSSVPDTVKNEFIETGFVETTEQSMSDIQLIPEIVYPPEDYLPDWELTYNFALAVPFMSVEQGVSINDIKAAWFGREFSVFNGKPLLLSKNTFEMIRAVWGDPVTGGTYTVPSTQLLTSSLEKGSTWVILPFEEINPRWKILTVSGISPIDSDFMQERYPLKVSFRLKKTSENFDVKGLLNSLPENPGNRKDDLFTDVILTGTTALVRNTALKMEEKGLLYPAKRIADLLKKADITHISNEVSFDPNCPPAIPLRREMRFCSSPEFINLLLYIGADVIDLTGNHLFDWGSQPFLTTLSLYDQYGLPYYGAGLDINAAREPLLIDKKGNKFAFIGCNVAGPEIAWAGEEIPGVAFCDFEQLELDIREVKSQGYIPIVTFQHFEADIYEPHSSQRIDFYKALDYGAVIVSGSQSHFPQAFAIQDGSFIHFGLGNLFFDQMTNGNEKAFIDRHIFYDGEYINTELIPIILVDYAVPHIMTGENRNDFLEMIYGYSKW